MAERYQDGFEEERKQIAKLSVQDQESAFLDYVVGIIEAKKRGEVSREEAAYAIADTMFLPGVDSNDGLEAIALLAGELELPDGQISGDPEQKWSQLEAWVQEEREARSK